MIRYFSSHATISNILMMAIIAIGLYSLNFLNKESFPLIKPDKVQVTVIYPGASPSDVEDGICNPLEDATDGISFLKEQLCDARDNMAIFTLQMHQDGEITDFSNDIKTEIDGIQNFPENIENPIVRLLGRTHPVASLAITSKNLNLAELKALAEDYRDRLIALNDIPIVKVSGFSSHQLQILIHPDTQQKYNLSVQNIASLIAAQSLQLPAGTLLSRSILYQITFDNAKKSVSELEDLVIMSTATGAQIKLKNLATIKNTFSNPEQHIELNGEPAAILTVSKNSKDDTLKVSDALFAFVKQENEILPEGTKLTIVNDGSSLVRDRLALLMKNGWQGLLLATMVLFLFFSWRYTFWIALGLPISFLGGLAMMVMFGISINMISMVALLMAIGILMDDAIVLSESIDHEYRKGKSPLDAAVDGTQKVFRGVLASFLTSAFLFGSLLMMQGDMGQILGVLPVVLLSVLTISLFEAFLILPHHLKHSLEHTHEKTLPVWREKFEVMFDSWRQIIANAAKKAMQYRYLTVAIALMMFIFSIGLMASGTVKFKAFPDLEGNNLQARILMSQGTPLHETREVVRTLLQGLNEANKELSENETESLVKHVQLSFGKHADVPESGSHLATLSVDILNTQVRQTKMAELIRAWQNKIGPIPNALDIQFKQAQLGPAGRAIHIRLNGENLDELSKASWKIQNWLRGYKGVNNLLDDLRPGKPQYSIQLKPAALAAGIDSRSIAAQLRSAFLEVKIDEIYQGREAIEIVAKLSSVASINGKALNEQASLVGVEHRLLDFDNFVVFTKTGQAIPLSSIANITQTRAYSRIVHVNHRRSLNIYGDVDSNFANTSEIINDLSASFLSELKIEFPHVQFHLKGEVENGTETRMSILSGFGLGAFAVFLLLSLIFANYREPLIVMINIPLALIGAIWGHFIMGLDFTLPSMIGFVSLAGIVVNDSILLVEFVKYHVSQGMQLHDAAYMAVQERFRAIFITSVTTIAGMTPLLFETSTQALVLIPLVTSIVFGMLTSTLLIMLVLPALYAIMEDIGFIKLQEKESKEGTEKDMA